MSAIWQFNTMISKRRELGELEALSQWHARGKY
jgi:hypothetical protein